MLAIAEFRFLGGLRRMRLAPTLVVAVLIGLTLSACQDEASAPSEPTPKPIVWERVEAHDPSVTRTLPGRLRAAQRAPLSFEVAGQIASVEVDTGDRFDKAKVLAKLDPGPFQLALDERQGELEQAQSALIETEGAFERSSELLKRGVVSKAAYDRAARALESSRKQIQTAQTRVAMAEDDLEDTVLTAPYAGYVAERSIEPSQRISAGEAVFEVQGAGGGLEVAVSFPETIVDRLVLGTEHQVRFPARPGVSMTGTVKDISTQAEASGAFPVTLTLTEFGDGSEPRLRVGMTAETTFVLPQARTASRTTDVASIDGSDAIAAAANPTDENEIAPPLISISVAAYLPSKDQEGFVFRFDEKTKTLKRLLVSLSTITEDRALVQAEDGKLPVGAIIASRGVAFLKDGQEVTLKDTGTARYNP